jgi:hypothetical protein
MRSRIRCFFFAASCVLTVVFPGLAIRNESTSTLEELPAEQIRVAAAAYEQVNVSTLSQEIRRFASYALSYQRLTQGNSPSSRLLFGSIAEGSSHLSEEHTLRKAGRDTSDNEDREFLQNARISNKMYPGTAATNELYEHPPEFDTVNDGKRSQRPVDSAIRLPTMVQTAYSNCTRNMLNLKELEKLSVFSSLSNLSTDGIQVIRGASVFGTNVSCPQSSSLGVPFITIFPISYLGDKMFLRDLLTYRDLIFDSEELETAANSSLAPELDFSLPEGLIASLAVPNLQAQCKKNGEFIQGSAHLFLGGGFTSSYLDELSALLKVHDIGETLFLQDSVLIASFTSEKKIRILAILRAMLRLAVASSSKPLLGGTANDNLEPFTDDNVAAFESLGKEIDPLSLCFYSNFRGVFEQAAFDMAMQLRIMSIFPSYNVAMTPSLDANTDCRNRSFEIDLTGMKEDGNVEAEITLNGRTCGSPAMLYRADGDLLATESSADAGSVANFTFLPNSSYSTAAYSDPTCGIGGDGSGNSITFSSTENRTYHGRLYDHSDSSTCEYDRQAREAFEFPAATASPEIEVTPIDPVKSAPAFSELATPSPARGSKTPDPSSSQVQQSPRGEIASCFPADAIVEMQGGKSVPIAQIQVGDRVRVGPYEFSTVIMFSHRDSSALTMFVRLDTSERTAIHLSPSHYIYANRRLVVASAVRVGDSLASGREETGNLTVINASHVYKRGLYNPQTTQGDIVVDGAVASTFTAALPLGLAKAFLAPLSALNRIYGLVLEPISSYFDEGAPRLAKLLPCGSAVYPV